MLSCAVAVNLGLCVAVGLSWHFMLGGNALGEQVPIAEEMRLIQKAEVVGLRFTRQETIWGLLPRPIPGRFTQPNFMSLSGEFET